MQPESTTGAPRRRRTHRSPAESPAFTTFHVACFTPLTAYCMADLHDWQEAEDLAAEALVVVWHNWAHLHAHDDRTLRACSTPRSPSWSRASARRCSVATATGTRWLRSPTSSASPKRKRAR